MRMFAAMIVFAAWTLPGAFSQQNLSSRTTDTPKIAVVPVMVDGRILFHVRGISAYPAEQRADIVSDRIVKIAANEKMSVDDLNIVESAQQTNIVAGNQPVIGLVDADAEMEGITRQMLAVILKIKIAEAIENYRREHSQSELLLKTAYSAVALILSAALIFLVMRLTRWLADFVETRYRSKIQGVRIQSFQLIQAEQLWLAVRGVVYMARTLLILVVGLLCVEYVLSIYPWTRSTAENTISLILTPLRSITSSIIGTIPDLAFIAILFLVVRYCLKLARLFFAGIANGTVTLAGFDPDWATPTYRIMRFLTIAFAAIVVYPYIPGAGSEAFKGITIFLGVIFSLGSTSIVANTIAGYTMTYRRAFRIGDRIQIGELQGDVEQIRIQVTHLRSLKNEEIIVPNSLILKSHVINYSALAGKQGLILHTTVGIGYETPWRQVESMLRMAAGRTQGLLQQPPPFVLQKSLGDFYVTYEINAYSDKPKENARLYTELHRNILDVFNEYGVQIMTPAYKDDPEHPKVVHRSKWFEAPATLPDRNPKI